MDVPRDLEGALLDLGIVPTKTDDDEVWALCPDHLANIGSPTGTRCASMNRGIGSCDGVTTAPSQLRSKCTHPAEHCCDADVTLLFEQPQRIRPKRPAFDPPDQRVSQREEQGSDY